MKKTMTDKQRVRALRKQLRELRDENERLRRQMDYANMRASASERQSAHAVDGCLAEVRHMSKVLGAEIERRVKAESELAAHQAKEPTA